VKPGNVLLDEQRHVHLTDFGIARLTDVTAITATGLVIGTAGYLAPEQVTGEGATPASDIYALGLVLLEALTGERAFPGSPSEAAVARLHRSPHVPATTNRSLAALLTAMTASDPTMRPSAAAIAESLRVGLAEQRDDATAVIPILGDETAAIAVAPEVAAVASPAATAPARTWNLDPRLWLIPAIVVGALLVALWLSATFGGTGSNTPAGADTATTIASTVPTTTAPSPTTVADTPSPAPRREHKGGHDG
jgi:hypothetical protein